MNPQIENPHHLALPLDTEEVLRQIFAGYRRVVVLKEFAVGLSGGRVLEVRPIKADGTPELPTVVKLASTSLIEQEWQAYKSHIHNRLPHIAAVNDQPTLLPSTGLGGLRYPVIGLAGQDIVSLREFVQQPEVAAERIAEVIERLLRIMDNIWGFHRATPDFDMRAGYDAALPPNLLVELAELPASTPVLLVTLRELPARDIQPGQAVELRGFVVHKVDPAYRTITLRAPEGAPAFAVRARLAEGAPIPSYRAQQVVDLPAGLVVETRQSRLCAEVAALELGFDPGAPRAPLGAGVVLPNPLYALPRLLARARGVNVATIHGDFNLENILVDPQLGDISLIDFAEARHDHVLHDLLHLEAEIVMHILPGIIARRQLDPARALADLGWRLHRAMDGAAQDPGPPEQLALRKPWAALRTIRLAARHYLFDATDAGEYYHGLALYMLGALRFKNLAARPEHPLPKRLAFWWAALACQWLAHPDTHTPPATLAPLLASAWGESSAPRGEATDDPAALLDLLPTDQLPPGGALPPASRMPLDRNARFVGRDNELLRLATTLRRSSADMGERGETSGEEAPVAGYSSLVVRAFSTIDAPLHYLRRPAHAGGAIAVAGMGGVGKTQLACEFTHRCGRFFAGGVFWINCANPAAGPAEVAACGDRDGMHLRPNFGELPLEQQIQLVLEAWRAPIPRLLIFDNCETPELIERFFPREGGARLLLTSRRADWHPELGIATLELDVLPRRASLALLRGHQPDADTDLLDQIAQELGDLPLALHLAGSYLARFRHETDAADYLACLRAASPLGHDSLNARGLLPTEHDGYVARTFALSNNQLDHSEPLSQLARALLLGAACLAPSQPIPEVLVKLALEAYAGDSNTTLAGFEFGSAVEQLVQLGLVRAEAGNTFWVHRLVAAFARDLAGTRLDRARADVERALSAEAERLNKGRDPSKLRGWQAHMRHVADSALPRGDAAAADLGHALAEHLYQTGDYQGARAYYEEALDIRQNVLGANHQATARSLAQIGKTLLFHGNIDDARPYLERALAIQRMQLGAHNDTATTLNHLGFLLQLKKELDTAKQYHSEALRMRYDSLGEQHPAVVDSLCNLAYVEYAQGELETARSLLERALAVQRKATGAEHPEAARLLTHLGELLLAQKKIDDAERTLRSALAIQERELGDEHPEAARTLSYLGDALRLSGDNERARKYYERALKVFQICHGAEHYRTQRVQEQIAALTCSS
jgi:tetratricopeptide (TPR) repeat protein